MVRVLLADAFPIVRRGLRDLLSTAPMIGVVAESDSPEQTRVLTREHHPDVIVLDLEWSATEGLGSREVGIDLVRDLRHEVPRCRILILTGSASNHDLATAFAEGVSGYILKQDDLDHLPQVILAVADNPEYTYLSPSAQNFFIQSYREPRVKGARLSVLTKRERQILELVIKGNSTEAIARLLGISVRTVSTHRSRILRKTRSKSFFELIELARS